MLARSTGLLAAGSLEIIGHVQSVWYFGLLETEFCEGVCLQVLLGESSSHTEVRFTCVSVLYDAVTAKNLESDICRYENWIPGENVKFREINGTIYWLNGKRIKRDCRQ